MDRVFPEPVSPRAMKCRTTSRRLISPSSGIRSLKAGIFIRLVGLENKHPRFDHPVLGRERIGSGACPAIVSRSCCSTDSLRGSNPFSACWLLSSHDVASAHFGPGRTRSAFGNRPVAYPKLQVPLSFPSGFAEMLLAPGSSAAHTRVRMSRHDSRLRERASTRSLDVSVVSNEVDEIQTYGSLEVDEFFVARFRVNDIFAPSGMANQHFGHPIIGIVQAAGKVLGSAGCRGALI